MKINIYTKLNGVGLQQDAEIIKAALHDHEVNIIDWNRPQKIIADIAFHLEHIRPELMRLAKINIAAPNPEWFEPTFKAHLNKIDIVMCKTFFTQELFSKMHKNCFYTSFTSIDKYSNDYKKFRGYLHLAGKSSHKGTEFITDAWRNNTTMPILYMQKLENLNKFTLRQKNVLNQFKRLDEGKLIEVMNTAAFHLCPSKAEGFGHYINEALSTGAIVITTDAAPMNELVRPEYGFLLPARVCGTHRLSSEYCINPKDLINLINELETVDDEILIDMSNKARQSFLQRDEFFKTKLNELICTLG